ncbi:T-cell antigen CD7 isoform X1 [Mesocricetus auratus]|uniref:T-cell antigen CD7 isoform X1 n=1 Tax=Mesocricetus auratus TaxID=10036 RepID=A0A1U7QBC5_MESAU|nr:T-cell antigen CD7 isoform X1 [Mesocricetus auratus]
MAHEALLALLLTLARVLPGPLDAQEMQHPPHQVLFASEGDSINITCSTNRFLSGIYLRQNWPQVSEVTYFEDGKESTVDKRFSGRIDFSGSQSNLTITMRLLRQENTGIYTCSAVPESKRDGLSTMVVVTEKLSQEACKTQEPRGTSVFLPAALAVGFFLLGLVLGVLCPLRKIQIKGLCASRDKDSRCVVYEDMSCSKRKTPCTPNQYHEALYPHTAPHALFQQGS